MMEKDEPDRELYALLHLPPDASDEDIKRAYRQWAQVYHPDKHTSPQMQGVATENFQRIREAYEILSDERKRQIYDIYGLEGLKSGLELGPKLKTGEILKEVEKLRQRQRQQQRYDRLHHTGSLFVDISLTEMWKSIGAGPVVRGMRSANEIQAQISKKNTLILGGNVLYRRGVGAGSVSAMVRHQISAESNVEVLAMVGLRSLLSIETSRQLSSHATGTMGVSLSLRDGSINLANTWVRQLSEDTLGNIQLVVGPATSVSVGWQRQGERNSGSGEVKLELSGFGVDAQYIRKFSSSSHGRISGKLGGGSGLEVEVGGQRTISDLSAFGMFCVLGTNGISWKFQFIRGGQEFNIPVLLSSRWSPWSAVGALFVPSSLYTLLKAYVIKPYFVRRRELRKWEQRQSTLAQVLESRAKADKAQSLLKNPAERKRAKQAEKGGLVIVHAVYGNLKDCDQTQLNRRDSQNISTEDTANQESFPPPVVDVTIALNFLVDDAGQLLLHRGVKKSGLLGFCDPCPGEEKQLKVIYTYRNNKFEVIVGDFDELVAPNEAHKLST